MTRIMPRYPIKLMDAFYGQVVCDADWTWSHHFIPSNGTGTSPTRTCAGAADSLSSGTSNQQAYYTAHDWGIQFNPTSWQLRNANATSTGMGKTVMEDFADTYVDLMDDLGLKWRMELSLASGDESVFAYNTLGATYESAFGPMMDYIEDYCSANFVGYAFEIAFHNFVKWIHGRTNYCISNKDWSGFLHSTTAQNDVNVLKQTDAGGNDIANATPAERFAVIDEIVIELFDANFVTWWLQAIPSMLSGFPNLPVVLNVDVVCGPETWSGTPLSGSPVAGTGIGYWAAAGATCAQEKAGCLSRITTIKNALGKNYSGLIYNFLNAEYPMNSGVPDIQWFLEWVDANITPSYLVSEGSTVSRNLGFSMYP